MRGGGEEKKKRSHAVERGGSRLSILEAEAQRGPVDAPSLQRSRGKYATARNKGRFRTGDYRFPSSRFAKLRGRRRRRRRRWWRVLPFRPSARFLYVSRSPGQACVPAILRARALNRSCVRQICEIKFISSASTGKWR